jgi:serine/threonine-protein kinase/endoribonuclease IRE1
MGLAKKLEQERASFSTTAARGTIGWQPPEVLGDKKHTGSGKVLKMTKKVDVFALGCIFYYVLTGQHPFGDRYEREVNIMSGKAPVLDGIDAEARDLISRMISPEPGIRPDGPEILSHPYAFLTCISCTFLVFEHILTLLLRFRFFWSSDRKLQFLRDASDFMEFEKPTAPIVVAFEKDAADRKVIPGKNGDWMEGLSEYLLQDLNRFRKYNGTKLRDLLRIVRNKAHHYRDLPPELQAQLGSFPEGYLSYFISRYPSLVIFTFQFVKENCSTDKAFADYFSS